MSKGFTALILLIIIGGIALLFFLTAFNKIPINLSFVRKKETSQIKPPKTNTATITPIQKTEVSLPTGIQNLNQNFAPSSSPISPNSATPSQPANQNTPTPTSVSQKEKDNGPPTYSSG